MKKEPQFLIKIIFMTLVLLIMPTILAETTNQNLENYNLNNPADIQALKDSPDYEVQECSTTYNDIAKGLITPDLINLTLLFIIIDTILKGFGMWRAVHRKSKIWFIAILIFNTIGILPLIYLIITHKRKKKSKKSKKQWGTTP